MRSWRRQATRRVPAEEGFTLVEVVVALVLLTMVTVGVATLFMRAVKDSTGLDRRQAAVAVAGQSMELVRSIPVTYDVSNHSKLLSGRYSVTVHNQFTSLASTVDLSQTDEESDAAATVSSTPVLPYTATTAVAGVTYTAQRIVGSCWRPPAGGDCVKAASKAAGSQLLFRVIVSVTWSEGGSGTSCSGACHYDLSTLVDPATDPTFNLNATNAAWPAAPVLNDLTVTTPMNTPVTVDLSTAKSSGQGPFTAIVGTASQGAGASVLPNTTQVTVTPATNYWSGSSITLTFTLTDPYGQVSNTRTLSVQVTPPAAPTAGPASVTTPLNTPVTVNLAASVSGGTGALAYGVGTASGGSLGALSGTSVTFTPPSGGFGTYTFTYTVSDAYGHNPSGTVTVTVPNPCGGVPTAVQDGTPGSQFQSVPHNSNATISVLTNDSQPANCGATTIVIVNATSNGSSGTASAPSGTSVKFNASWLTGYVNFSYKLTNNLGTSSTVTVYLKVT
jgi:type II secretory pathway pseudopilin PulG